MGKVQPFKKYEVQKNWKKTIDVEFKTLYPAHLSKSSVYHDLSMDFAKMVSLIRFGCARNLSVSQSWPALVQPFYVYAAGLGCRQSCKISCKGNHLRVSGLSSRKKLMLGWNLWHVAMPTPIPRLIWPPWQPSTPLTVWHSIFITWKHTNTWSYWSMVNGIIYIY